MVLPPPGDEIRDRNRILVPSRSLRRVGAEDHDHSAGIFDARGPQHPTAYHAEDRRVGCDSKGQRHDSHGRETRVLAEHAGAKSDIHEKIFNRRPAPHGAAVFLRQRYIPKLAPRRVGGFLPRHTSRNQLLDLFFEVLLNLFGEIAVEAASRKQLFQPHHDSPGAKTRVIPSSIFSKRDTSCSKCFAPFAVSLYVRTRRFVDEMLHSAFTNSSLRSRWSAG